MTAPVTAPALTGCRRLLWLLQGNGFVTDPAIIKEFGIHDANPFFTTLLSKPYLDNVVISPHLYGPSVSNRKDFYKGAEWMASLDKAFGYLSQKPGYCANGKCHVFPVAVGEFGSRFTNPEDLAHLEDLALYMNAQGAGNTGGHKAFNNWFYVSSTPAGSAKMDAFCM